jgi:glutathione S-transferase
MRFMVMVKANKGTEAGEMPSEAQLAEMGRFNEEMAKAGVMLSGEGLHPTMKGARIRFSDKGATAVDGPFSADGLVCGFWMIETASRDEAIAWMKRAPFAPGDDLELRQVFEAEDFGEALTPELRQQEERLRVEVAARR